MLDMRWEIQLYVIIPKQNTLSMVYQHTDSLIHVITTILKTYETNYNGLLVGRLPVAKKTINYF